ncbi:MAG: hypothetical protein ACYC5F_05220 [Thermoleophilia bacterium]
MALEVSALVHDIGKMSADNQLVLRGLKTGKTQHKVTKTQLAQYINSIPQKLRPRLGEKDLSSIWEFSLHHSLSDDDIRSAARPAFGVYGQVLRWSDWLASMAATEQLDLNLIERLQNEVEGVFRLTVFTVARYPSPTTNELLQQAVAKYTELGWRLLVILDDAAVFIGALDLSLPNRSSFVAAFTDTLVLESLKRQTISTSFFRHGIISGKAKEDPAGFLRIKRSEYLNLLAEVEAGPVVFFATLIELYKLAKKLPSSAKMRKEKWPILDILIKASGPNGITPAKKEWKKIHKIADHISVNELVADIFNNISVSQVVVDSSDNTKLNRLRKEQQFQILLERAEQWFPQEDRQSLNEAVACMVGMEEETDFAEMANRTFLAYCNYKTTRKPKNSLCEQCATPVPIEATRALNFPKTVGFTQVNPRVESDSPLIVCPLCVFDAGMMRRDVSPKWSAVFARVTSPVPDLWYLYGDIKKWIQKLSVDLVNVRKLKQLEEQPVFSDWPLPPRTLIPLISEQKDSFQSPIDSERGILFHLEPIESSESPKNLRARYLALHALLNGMGFTTHIGKEQQVGLFGEKAFSHTKADWWQRYNFGLAINILARALIIEGKGTNSYVLSRNLIENSPSTMLMKLEAAVSAKSARLDETLLVRFFESLMNGDFSLYPDSNLRGGKVIMKEILHDAVFFADGIPKFFWTLEDRNRWRTGPSKYLITKPVDRMLNGLLQGLDFDEAFSRFLQSLRDDIALDKEESRKRLGDKKGAKFDQKDLAAFVSNSRLIFLRYAELKNTNITRFIQAKNGLRAAIYITKRYEKLQEVIRNEAY